LQSSKKYRLDVFQGKFAEKSRSFASQNLVSALRWEIIEPLGKYEPCKGPLKNSRFWPPEVQIQQH